MQIALIVLGYIALSLLIYGVRFVWLWAGLTRKGWSNSAIVNEFNGYRNTNYWVRSFFQSLKSPLWLVAWIIAIPLEVVGLLFLNIAWSLE